MSAIVVCMMWRRKVAFDMQAAALATATLLATPYIFVYDLVVPAIPMAFLIRAARASGFLRGEIAWLAAANLCILLFPAVHAPIGLAAVLIVAVLAVRRAYLLHDRIAPWATMLRRDTRMADHHPQISDGSS